MMRLHRIFVSVASSCVLTMFAATPNVVRAQSGTTVCHVPPGDPANAHTIVVDGHSLPAHLAHGDQLGACAPACQNSGGACDSSADCCGDLQCTGSYKTCASVCTIGPELGGDYCGLDLDCCDGACLFGTCWSGYTCHLPGEPCTEDPQTLNDLCCLGASCVDGICAF